MTTTEKANVLLKVRLPNLAELGLNFEKRTGNFFIASLIADPDTGEQKVTRRVVPKVELPTSCKEEAELKRAAALVVGFNKVREKQYAALDEARAAVAKIEQEIENFDADLEAAAALVDGYDIPEKQKNASVTKEKLAADVAKLRAMLLKLGFDPDAPEQEEGAGAGVG